MALKLGAGHSGGANSLLARGTLEGLAANDNGAGGNDELKSHRLELKLGYGPSAFGDRFTWTPEAGVGLSDMWRTKAATRGALEIPCHFCKLKKRNDTEFLTLPHKHVYMN